MSLPLQHTADVVASFRPDLDLVLTTTTVEAATPVQSASTSLQLQQTQTLKHSCSELTRCSFQAIMWEENYFWVVDLDGGLAVRPAKPAPAAGAHFSGVQHRLAFGVLDGVSVARSTSPWTKAIQQFLFLCWNIRSFVMSELINGSYLECRSQYSAESSGNFHSSRWLPIPAGVYLSV